MPQPFTRTDVDLAVLRDELEEILGRPIELSILPPETFEQPLYEDVIIPEVIAGMREEKLEDGSVVEMFRGQETGEMIVVGTRATGETEMITRTGEIYILDRETGEEIDVDSKTASAAFEAHVPPAPIIPVEPLSNEELLKLRALLNP